MSKPRVGSFGTNGFSFKRSVFVEKKGECRVVRVDKVMEIIRRVSEEPRVGNITLELRDTRPNRFEAPERECRQPRRRQWRNSQCRENRTVAISLLIDRASLNLVHILLR